MPEYSFKHPKKKKYIDVIMSMTEEHRYIDDKGVEWERIWHNPNASIDTKINPFSAQDFVNKTAKKKENYGDLLDRAAEASAAREHKEGFDVLEQKKFSDYRKKNKGRMGPAEMRKKAKETVTF